jgi:hypothetical protein
MSSASMATSSRPALPRRERSEARALAAALALCAAALGLAACSSSAPGAGPDAGAPGGDSGSPGIDSGSPDSGADAGFDAGSSDAGTSGTDAGALAPGDGGSGLFLAAEPWTRDVSASPKSSSSDAITAWLADNGGWGTGQLRIDFSIEVLTAGASTPFLTFNPTGDFYKPDCDHVPFPVPAGGVVEGETGYACTGGGDCHLLVVHQPTNKLYEMWEANIVGSTFSGGCAAVWDLTRAYPDNLRGDDCTSADAGGFPIAALLFTADEIASGSLNHAVRFILPNAEIRRLVYVHPGTHSTNSTSGGSDAPPYGVRMRLRAGFPLASLPNDAARTIARGLQRYGMFLADGGNIALTARSDRTTTAKWATLLGSDMSRVLDAIQPQDMEVVELGTLHTFQDNCLRNP